MDIKNQTILNKILNLIEDLSLSNKKEGYRLGWHSPATMSLILAKLIINNDQLLWIDAPSESEAKNLAYNLSIFLPHKIIHYFPGFAQFVGCEASPPEVILHDRLATLIALLEYKLQVLITGPLTAREILPHPKWFKKQKLEMFTNTKIPKDLLLETLITLGYKQTNNVYNHGEFSTRGLIVDIWPDHFEKPIRLEFFDDNLSKISSFDTNTQLRIEDKRDSITIYPRFEGERNDKEILLNILNKYAIHTKNPEDDLEFRRERLISRGYFPGEELFYSLLNQPKGQLAHWIAPCLRIKLESSWADAIANKEEKQICNNIDALRQGGVICPSFKDCFKENDPSRVSIILTEQQSKADILLQSQPIQDFKGQFSEFINYIKDFISSGHHVFLSGSTEGICNHLTSILQQHKLPIACNAQNCQVINLPISNGFYLKEPKLLIMTEQEIFGRKTVPVKTKHKIINAFLSDFRDLKSGDLVIHLDHGIGKFIGFKNLIIGGNQQEVIQLKYADNAILNVNLERADLIQRYITQDCRLVKLDKIGGTAWVQVKSRAKIAIRNMTEELLKLYTKRKLEKSHACQKDGVDMIAFEAIFPFELTPDQIEAIEAVKSDLESNHPMDRLLCGDVGFGKTEVAMRASAKVVIDRLQVAILCPTTILCFQHFRTFKERFSGFPVRIEMLNRFVETQQAKDIIQDLANGSIDIVIGTHQLLSEKICFSNLGLLIIDEEQKFGVNHKERLKKIKCNIHVLTMSATPIPRTLHMGLAGLREVSLIETPPKDRLAIETIIAPWNDELVASAIQFELRRGGQVYVVHNKIESIANIADRIRKLVPNAKVAVGHAQLTSKNLELIMLGFMEKQIDVLVSTTIIENGLDVPNANTIIIHRADTFGLSQLYQLRGRVGRSDVPAYAYLLIPNKNEIASDAQKRLQALEDFSELGSGFRIAAMDLELRGAGNILGGEQSGQINDIGFEFYIKLLNESLQELQNKSSSSFETKINLGCAQISSQWIQEASERLVVYKRTSTLNSDNDLDLYYRELTDRFGHIPVDDNDSEFFFDILKIRIKAKTLAISEITSTNKCIKFHINSKTIMDPIRIINWVHKHQSANITPDGMIISIQQQSIATNKDTKGTIVRQVNHVLDDWMTM